MRKLTGKMTICYPNRTSEEVPYTTTNVANAIAQGATWYLSGRDYDTNTTPFPRASAQAHTNATRKA